MAPTKTLPTRRRCRRAGASQLVAAFFLLAVVSSAAAADLSTVNLPGERLPLEKVAPQKIPQPLPLAGALAPNKLLQAAQPIFPEIIGCKLPAIDAINQLLYCGDEYGDIWEASLANFPSPTSPPRVLARTGGRPLSHALSADGSRLVLTDAVRGLLALDLTRKALAPNTPLTLLSGYASDPAGSGAASASGPVSFAQGLALTPTAYYFSDTADAPPALPPSPGKAWNAFGATRANLFSGKPTGRLLRYDVASGATAVVASGLYVANGIALSNEGDAIILNESMSMKVLRIPLSGPSAGVVEEFSRSPGYLDSLSATPARDGYWVCVFSLASQTIPGLSTALAAAKPLRAVAGNLPESVTGAFIARGDGVMLLGNAGGEPLGWLEDPDGSVVAGVSGVVQYGDKLLLTAFDGPIKVVDVPAFASQSG